MRKLIQILRPRPSLGHDIVFNTCWAIHRTLWRVQRTPDVARRVGRDVRQIWQEAGRKAREEEIAATETPSS